MRRRTSLPQELEDPEDIVIGPGEGDLFEPHEVVPTNDGVASSSTSATTTTSIQSSNVSTTVALPSTPTQPSIGPPPSTTTDSSSSKASSPFSWTNESIPREFRNLIAGGLAGMTAKSVVAPFDRIKILYQVSSAEFHFSSLPSVVGNILREEGWTALWKGNTATMIRVFPYSGIQFMVFDRCKRYFLHQHHADDGYFTSTTRTQQSTSSLRTSRNQPHQKHGLTALESLIAGMVAGTISVISTYPLDLTRAQLAVLKHHKQSTHISNKGFVQVLTDNYIQRGVGGLFRGISPTLMGILPYSGVAFTLNEQGKRNIQHLTKRDLTTMERMQCGAFAGLFAQTATYPIEVTRRRMQTLGLVGNDTAFGCLKSKAAAGSAASPSTSPSSYMENKPESMLSTVRHLYAEQGLRGFFKGVSMNWMKGPVAFSISFTTFDTIQGWFESEAERAQRLPRRFTMKPPDDDDETDDVR